MEPPSSSEKVAGSPTPVAVKEKPVAPAGLVTLRTVMEPATYTLLASAPSPARPSPVARVSDSPRTENVVVAWMSTLPAVGLLITTEHWPAPPLTVQLAPPGAAGTKTAVAPALFVRLKVTTVPSGAALKPVKLSPPGASMPSFCFTVAVIVWFALTGFVAVSGLMLMFASTNFLLPSAPLLPPVLVARVRLMPPTRNVEVAWMSTLPAVVVVITTWQVPRPFEMVQVAPAGATGTNTAFAVLTGRLKLTMVPFGAGAKPVTPSPPCAAVSPSFWLTVAVIVCEARTELTAVSGVTAMPAST